MELRTMRYFLAAAREENMTRAAELLHVTQPTLSKQLKALEEELGKKLFTRHSFSIQLTEEGILLRKRAEDLVKMADKITTEFLALDDILGGDVYFGRKGVHPDRDPDQAYPGRGRPFGKADRGMTGPKPGKSRKPLAICGAVCYTGFVN